jgi:hypothetical protein
VASGAVVGVVSVGAALGSGAMLVAGAALVASWVLARGTTLVGAALGASGATDVDVGAALVEVSESAVLAPPRIPLLERLAPTLDPNSPSPASVEEGAAEGEGSADYRELASILGKLENTHSGRRSCSGGSWKKAETTKTYQPRSVRG